MSEATRQRRLHLENRLEELNAKYGPIDDAMPDWLDHLPEKQPRPVRAVAHGQIEPARARETAAGAPALAVIPPSRPISEELPV